MDKKIDLIVPIYKAHKTLFRLLCSIAQQAHHEWVKVTLINDCCPEGSYKEIIKKFEEVLDIQEIILPVNKGPGYARQYGVDHTDCPYIMFADADDILFGGFVFNDLLNEIERRNEDVIFSSFIEYTPIETYLHHINDNVWVFGKIYRREFLKKYNIRFTEQRANEDTFFNKKIMFIYKELGKTIPFVEGFAYGWYPTKDSITTINHHQYSYDQGICGFVDGAIELFDWAEKQKINKIFIKNEILSTMIFLYISYCDVSSKEEFFQEQNFEFIKKYYHKLWKKYNLEYKTQDFIDAYEENMQSLQESQYRYQIFMAQPNIMEFMDMLEHVQYNEEDIYRIWDKIPQEVKDNNIKCGVVAKDYYEKSKK